MRGDTLRDHLRRIPFHPVTLLLPSSKTITVNNPELAMFTVTGRTLIVSQGDRGFFIDVATVGAIETVPD